jgi:hypothetical protein
VTVRFNDATRELLDAKNFATVATLNPDAEEPAGGPKSKDSWWMRQRGIPAARRAVTAAWVMPGGPQM